MPKNWLVIASKIIDSGHGKVLVYSLGLVSDRSVTSLFGRISKTLLFGMEIQNPPGMLL
jgi:hypothetical protein